MSFLIDRIDPNGAEERRHARIRVKDAAHEKSKRNRQVLDEIAKEIINYDVMNKWRDKIRQALKTIEDDKSENPLWDYFTKREDILRNINVIYLFLAMCHDDIIGANFIITEDLKKMNPALFPNGLCPWYGIETRLPLFWEHVKQDLSLGQAIQEKKTDLPKYAKNAGELYDFALSKNPELRTDDEVYSYLETPDNLPDENIKLPDRESFKRNLRTYRNKTGTSKNKHRAGRTFKNKLNSIEKVSDISNQYNTKPE